jgi:hypothetical protein
MTRLVPTGYSEQDAKIRFKAHFEAHFDQAPNDVLGTPLKFLKMTATLKRRALKKKSDKKAGKGGAIPAVLSFARPE